MPKADSDLIHDLSRACHHSNGFVVHEFRVQGHQIISHLFCTNP